MHFDFLTKTNDNFSWSAMFTTNPSCQEKQYREEPFIWKYMRENKMNHKLELQSVHEAVQVTPQYENLNFTQNWWQNKFTVSSNEEEQRATLFLIDFYIFMNATQNERQVCKSRNLAVQACNPSTHAIVHEHTSRIKRGSSCSLSQLLWALTLVGCGLPTSI